ncbi:PH domain-containing protein [Pseudovibrio ascidiaceicola]|uniref:PH domain-containing protein n=1 Tax=Pseudovibrio ascidiaceicola TaxID=285279 RepID=UPI000D69C6CF|nr:PH domain-containing protein [Pseudovibrio ascidiaceicola]
MIDFDVHSEFSLSSDDSFAELVPGLLIEGEEVIGSYSTGRDGVVFTNLRVMPIDVQGFTGKKRDFTSLPYKKVTAYSVETAGTLDADVELDLVISGLGKVKFRFYNLEEMVEIARHIAKAIL